jgi:outer membrane protein assembly factor BamA
MGVESLAGVDLSYAMLNSNQSNYDAKRTKFNENYYDYSEWGIGPRLNTRFKEKLGLGLSYLYSRRDYAKRPVQNGDGSYTTDKISTNVTTFRTSISYPIIKGLAIEAQGAWQTSASNMKYETVYRYGYSSSNYFLGFSYQL